MSAKIVIDPEQDLEQLVLDSWYSGERFVIKNKTGLLAAIVPIEDLAVLEEMDCHQALT